MRYLSIFSGIEAASVAWGPLGWRAFGFAEIEPFPCEVLKHHYPEVPNFGNVEGYQSWPDAAVDVLIGGSPCQSFSVAGLRQGMLDPRGNLALIYLAVADRYRPKWIIFENVPGLLSSNDGRDFGAFLGGLGELGYGFAYRVLDAQYVRIDGFGRAVPQRRRRVFVVGYLGDWRRAAAVLFDAASLRGDIAPRRGERQDVAAAASYGISPDCFDRDGEGAGGSAAKRSGLGVDEELAYSIRAKRAGGVAHALNAHGGPAGRIDAESETFVVAPPLTHNPYGDHESREGLFVEHAFGIRSDASRDGQAKSLSVDAEGRMRLRNPGLGIYSEIAPTIDAGQPHSVAHALRAEGFDASEDGTGRGTPIIPILEIGKGSTSRGAGPNGCGLGEVGDPMFTLQAGAQHAIAFDTTQITSPTNRCRPQDGDLCHPLAASAHAPAVAETLTAYWERSKGAKAGNQVGVLNPIIQNWAVRRLTPLECERLQGFPDGWTAIPRNGKIAADGPRYKALGNSIAINCIRWIGYRMQMVENLN